MMKMDGDGVDLSSLGGAPLYCPTSDLTTRMLIYDDEAFFLPGTFIIHNPQINGDNANMNATRLTTNPEQTDYDGLLMRDHSKRGVSLGPSATALSYPGHMIECANLTSPWRKRFRSEDCRPKWHPSYSMYLCFIFGFLCAAGHHIFYASLDGKLAESQTEMLRYGTILAYAAKSGFSAAVVSALKQRTWLTVRRRFMSIRALDSMFAAAENIVAMFNFEFLRNAKGAFALAFFSWTTPLVVRIPIIFCHLLLVSY